MNKFSSWLVDRRRRIFVIMMLLTAFCAILIPKVKINTDMTKYLPDNSRMKQGLDLMTEEFGGLPANNQSNTVRVMFRAVPENEKTALLEELKKTPNADSVSFSPGSTRFERGDYTLFILNFSCGFFSREMREAESYISKNFTGRYDMVYCLDKTSQQGIPLWIVALAVILLIVILVVMSHSYLEPLLYLFAIGCAVVINLGTNIFLKDVAEVTFSISAILQLALSMDYSVILTGRFRQELEKDGDKEAAMKRAVSGAFSSIAGSSLTTVAGLLVLGFMSFKIGLDLGFVLAKGVFLSMVSIFTILPHLLLVFHGAVRKTEKKVPVIRTDALSRASYRGRRVIAAGFAVFFVLMLILKSNTGIAFTLLEPNDIDPVFPKENQIVLLYENGDETAVNDMIPDLETDPSVNSVLSYPNTLGRSFTADELLELIDTSDIGVDIAVPPIAVKLIYSAAGKRGGSMTPAELLDYVTRTMGEDSAWSALLNQDMKDMLKTAPEMLEEAGGQLKGEKYSRMLISTNLPQESEETAAFMEKLTALGDGSLSGEYYLIGNTPMAYEMVGTFGGELNFISILTAAAIFIIVLVTFRSLAVPAVLILLIQSAVYATMVIMNLQGMKIYYIALLVVQSILMGATIDYAIVFTNYYREFRMEMEADRALAAAYRGSLHTILTSGLVLVSVTGIVGFAFSDPSVRQIVHTISKGSAVAVCLILFVLPGVLAALDRFIAPKGKR